MRVATDSTARWLALCCVLGALAYLPVLNNGFIADDYVILQRVEILRTHPLYLYRVPPENFRSVSYVIFGFLKAFAGYRASFFYAFNIGLHLTNIVLLFRFLRILVRDEITRRIAVLLFAVFQAPQEAIMWLAAMNETTLFLFTVLTLFFWSQNRYGLAALMYSFALFSKESAVVIPILVLLLDLQIKKEFLWRKYVFLVIPSVGFAVIFLFTASSNFMLTTHSYAFGPRAILVLARSFHRLLWPWFYIFLVLAWMWTRRTSRLSTFGWGFTAVVLTMVPYMFIAYQTSLPSRQLYLASAGLMTLFAAVLTPLHKTTVLSVGVSAFVVFNIGYLWIRKDQQFEERAAPTTELIRILRQHSPQKIIIRNFPYPYPEIATAAVLAVPGWDPGLLKIGDHPPCTDCLELKWNQDNTRYESQRP